MLGGVLVLALSHMLSLVSARPGGRAILVILQSALGGIVAFSDTVLKPIIDLSLKPGDGPRSQPDRFRETAISDL